MHASKAQNHQKHKNATKQKLKNANKREKKFKMRLKTSKGEKFTYSLICVFGLDSLSMQL